MRRKDWRRGWRVTRPLFPTELSKHFHWDKPPCTWGDFPGSGTQASTSAVAVSISKSSEIKTPVPPPTVRRLTICDGPLACHAIQGCIYRYVCACAAAVSDGDTSRKRELAEWLMAVLDTIMACLQGKAEGDGTDAKRLRCAMFLLQLLINILKSERGASHPERSNHPAPIDAVGPPTVSTKAESAPEDEACSGWEGVAAEACARVSNAYLEEMVREVTRLVLGEQDGDTNVTGFWALSLLADVLKGLRKGRGSCRDHVGFKRKLCGDMRGTEVACLSSATAAVVDTVGVGKDDGHGCSLRLATSEQLDISGVTAAVVAFPVHAGTEATDVALKWLEVIQLLMEIAETRCQSLLADMLLSVPPTLWKTASRTGSRSLLRQEARPRPPGAAFVEVEGADSALAQAMLTLVFRMVRLGGAQGSRHMPERYDADMRRRDERCTEGRTNDGDGQGRKLSTMRPWKTAAEALVVTAAACADAEGSCFGFAGRLVRLFSDQDDALVDMLLTNLYIFHDTRSTDQPKAVRGNYGSAFPPELESLYRGVLHPGVLFAALLFEVRFDSGVLLDWLISPETSFLRYLTMLLRFAVAEWPQFAARVSCSRIVTLETRAQMSAFMAGVEEEEEEEELVLSDEEADRLSKSVSCLSGLVTSARALEKNGLVPYNLAPLLRRIDQVVSLYEDCGDADAEEGE